VSDEPLKIAIVGTDDTIGRELARALMRDPRLAGRVQIVEKLPEDHRPVLEPLDLDAALERIRRERPEYLVAPQQAREHHDLQPHHGKSKYDRRRQWWNR